MIAAWYDRQGPPAEVLQVGELPPAKPGPGESVAVAEVFPLAQIAVAHELIESGRATGRVLVSLSA